MNADAPRGTQTLARGLDVLDAVVAGASTLDEIADASGLPRSTAHRLLQLLRQRALVAETSPRCFRPGLKLVGYGSAALKINPLHVVSRPVLEQLAQQERDTIHLGERDDDDVVYLDKIESSRGAQMRSRIGARMPLTRTGVGMALLLDDPKPSLERLYRAQTAAASPKSLDTREFLARMATYRDQGFAFDLEDNELGIRCVAAPVRDQDGRIVAAISITATTPYLPPARMRQLGPVVVSAAAAVANRLAGR